MVFFSSLFFYIVNSVMLAEPQAVSDKKLNVIIEEAYTTEKNLTAGFIKKNQPVFSRNKTDKSKNKLLCCQTSKETPS